MSTCFIVATPIGNLADLSPRAADVLRSASVVYCEDTRVTRRLLQHVGAHTRLRSFNDHNASARIPEALADLSRGDIAYASDAGTPGLNDPGQRLVAAARAAGHAVVPLPGPHAAAAALSVAGFFSDRYVHLGFLPRGASQILRAVEQADALAAAVLAYEAPSRLARTLAALAARWPDRAALVARELTKLHEETAAGPLADLARRFAGSVRGEVVLALAPVARGREAAPAGDWHDELQRLRAAGVSPTRAVAEVARRFGVRRAEAYAAWRALRPP